jgi:hypothetical protein
MQRGQIVYRNDAPVASLTDPMDTVRRDYRAIRAS